MLLRSQSSRLFWQSQKSPYHELLKPSRPTLVMKLPLNVYVEVRVEGEAYGVC